MDECRKNGKTSLSEKFSLLTDELLHLSYGRVSEKKQMEVRLNELNLLDYRYVRITNTNTVLLLVHQLCTKIQSCDTPLVKSYSQLIVNIVQAGGSVTGRTFCTCEKWVLDALEYAKLDTRNNVLLALQVLLQSGPFDHIAQTLRPLLGENGLLSKLFFAVNDDYWTESNYLALSCLEAILVNKENSAARIAPEYGRIIREIVLTTLYSLTCHPSDKILYNKMVCCCLRVLCKLINDEAATIDSPENVGEILGVVKAFLFHGINGYSPIKVQSLRPAAMNLPEVVHIRGNNTRNKVRPKRQTPKKTSGEEKKSGNSSPPEKLAASCKYSSDSDTESFTPAQTESTVRLEALHLLHAAMKSITAREMFGYWSQIVASGSRDSARVLTRSVLKEPVAKVRRTVLSTLSKLLVNAKHFLLHADDSEHPSFLTFFGTVGAMIRELHLALSLALSYERNPTVLIHALKCASGLAQGTPYARLKSGLATKLSRNCRVHIIHKDPTVRVSALSVFESLASTEPLTPEIIGILGKESIISDDEDFPRFSYDASSGVDCDDQEEAMEFESIELTNNSFDVESDIEDEPSREKGISSLLQVSLKYISNEDEKGPVRLHSLKFLGALASNVESLVFDHFEAVTATLAAATQDTDVQVAHHACRVIETLAGRVANSCPEDVNVVAFWNTVFAPVTSLIQHSQMTLREVTCDCLGNIGTSMFSQLPRERSILIITILFGAVRDEESAVRAAAVRALGMLVTMLPLEEDTGFLMDLVDIVCRTIADQNLGVRVKACWTLANLCDCLTRHKANELSEPVPLDIILPRLYATTVKAAEDNCKVKCNAMRAVGSIVRLCTDQQVIADASDGLQVLIKCAISEKDMKVRWNACRALGFVMSYKPDVILPSSWRDQVFPVLCDLIGHSPNFKVRTNAAWALSTCESYGKYSPFLWRSIVTALENSRHVPSFVEYPHRDALIQQLCLTLGHLAARTDLSDLQSVWLEVRDHLDDISRHMKHLHDNVLPEKADDLVEAKTQLQRLFQAATNSQDRLVAKELENLFERTHLYDDHSLLEIKK